MQTTRTTYTDGDSTRRKASRGLAIYFAMVALLSAPVEAAIIAADLECAPTMNYGSHRELPHA
jgi:hypothetical protein